MTAILSLLLSLCLWQPSEAQQLASVPVNRQAAHALGLVAWWRGVPGFAGSPRWYDLLGQAHGTLLNMGTTGTGSGWGVSNRPGGQYQVRCDGTNDYATFVPPRLTGGEYTLMFWANDSLAGGVLNLHMTYGSNDFRLSLDRGNWGSVQDAITILLNVASGADLSPASSIPVNTWTHIAVTLSASQGVSRGYINGLLTGTGGYTETFGAGSASMSWCNRQDLNGTWANGAYDDLRWYTRVLTAAQVQQAYIASRQGDPQLLRAPLLALGLPTTVTPSGASGSFFPFFGSP